MIVRMEQTLGQLQRHGATIDKYRLAVDTLKGFSVRNSDEQTADMLLRESAELAAESQKVLREVAP